MLDLITMITDFLFSSSMLIWVIAAPIAITQLIMIMCKNCNEEV